MKTQRSVVVFVSALVFAACNCGGGAVGAQCQSQADCQGALVCLDTESCATKCTGDAECGANEKCSTTGGCVPKTGCGADGDCLTAQACNAAGVCAQSCQGAGSCGSTAVCLANGTCAAKCTRARRRFLLRCSRPHLMARPASGGGLEERKAARLGGGLITRDVPRVGAAGERRGPLGRRHQHE